MADFQEILEMNQSMLIDLHHSLTAAQTTNLEMMGLLSRLQTLQTIGFFVFALSVLLSFHSIRSIGIRDLKQKVNYLLIGLLLVFGLKQLVWFDLQSLYIYVNTSGGLSALAIGKHYFGVYALGVFSLTVGFVWISFYFFKTKPRSE